VTTDARQIVLSDDLWRRRFGGDPRIIGSPVTLDGESYAVRGVMPAAFRFPNADVAFYVPLILPPGGGRGMLLPTVARLAADASVAAVIEEGRRFLDEEGDRLVQRTLIVRTLHDQLVGHAERAIWIVFGAVALVTLIATANLALLLLVRGAARAQELGVRLALGASRARLVRQLLGEALALATAGGALGVLLAWWLTRVLARMAPDTVPRVQEVSFNFSVLVFAVSITLLTATAFGVLSAGRTIAGGVSVAFGRTPLESRLLSSRSPRRRMHALAAGELALTMVLLVAAGVLLTSFLKLALVDHGFNPRRAVALRVSLPPVRYPSVEARAAFQRELLQRLQQVAHIEAAGLATSMPNRQGSARFDFNAKAMPVAHDPFTAQIAEVRMVTEGFFSAMGIPIQGRGFTASDTAGAEAVIVVSRQLAQVHFGDQDPVGKMLYSLATGPVRVVGVVADVLPFDGRPASPAAYLPVSQNANVLQWFSTVNVVLRGSSPEVLIQSARAAVRALDADAPVFDARRLTDDVAALVAGPQFVVSVLAAFATVALVIAAIGVYGVMAYSTGQRTREMGIRTALGATQWHVTQTMLREAGMMVGAGLSVGLLASLWMSSTLTGLVQDMPPADGRAVGAVAVLLTTVSMLAAYVPARRSTRMNAVEALRHE
jgi:predicted permease